MKNILITGGAGFIGSHICLEFLAQQKNVFIIDSFINSNKNVFHGIKKILIKENNFKESRLHIFKGDIRDTLFLSNVFFKAKQNGTPIESVIHCAGLKAVKESFINPIKYWDFNVGGSINLLKVMEKNNCRTILFSSSATVYGNSSEIPFKETLKTNPINPYGFTKVTIENILDNLFESKKNKWKVGYLRYFNPIGAHPSGLIGENSSSKPENIFPIICEVASGLRDQINIFGNDWPTSDGTCQRDYLHVVDLAKAHRMAMSFLNDSNSTKLVLNIGRGESTSVLDLIKAFEKTNKIKINYKFTNRRSGDVGISLANTEKMVEILKWKPEKSIEDMCRDGWKWQKSKLKN